MILSRQDHHRKNVSNSDLQVQKRQKVDDPQVTKNQKKENY